jgi:hypothetical protein
MVTLYLYQTTITLIQQSSKIIILASHYLSQYPPTRTGPTWWVMARSPYVYSTMKASAPAEGTLID